MASRQLKRRLHLLRIVLPALGGRRWWSRAVSRLAQCGRAMLQHEGVREHNCSGQFRWRPSRRRRAKPAVHPPRFSTVLGSSAPSARPGEPATSISPPGMAAGDTIVGNGPSRVSTLLRLIGVPFRVRPPGFGNPSAPRGPHASARVFNRCTRRARLFIPQCTGTRASACQGHGSGSGSPSLRGRTPT